MIRTPRATQKGTDYVDQVVVNRAYDNRYRGERCRTGHQGFQDQEIILVGFLAMAYNTLYYHTAERSRQIIKIRIKAFTKNTLGKPTNTLRKGDDIVICEPMTNDLAGPRRFRTIHLKK